MSGERIASIECRSNRLASEKTLLLLSVCLIWQRLVFLQNNVLSASIYGTISLSFGRKVFNHSNSKQKRAMKRKQGNKLIEKLMCFCSLCRPCTLTLISIWTFVSCMRGLLSPASLNMRTRANLRGVVLLLCISTYKNVRAFVYRAPSPDE